MLYTLNNIDDKKKLSFIILYVKYGFLFYTADIVCYYCIVIFKQKRSFRFKTCVFCIWYYFCDHV